MNSYEGILYPQFQNSTLSRRHYIFPQSKLQKYKDKISDIMIYPRIKKYLKASEMINHQNISDLKKTYRLHKKEHPGCSILPSIKQEISKKINDSPSISHMPPQKTINLKPVSSKTPNPRITFSQFFSISKLGK